MAKPSDASEVGTHNVVKAAMEHLSENQKNDVEKLPQSFRELCLESFVINRTGGARQVTPFPKPMMVGEASDTTQGPSAAVIHELVNQAVHHALINQSGVLVNTLQNLIKQTVDGAVHKEPDKGPAYFATSDFKNRPAGPQSPEQAMKYTMARDVNPCRFPPDPSAGIPRGYHVAVNYMGQYSGWNQPYRQATSPGPALQQVRYAMKPETEGWADKIAEIMKEQFALILIGSTGSPCLISTRCRISQSSREVKIYQRLNTSASFLRNVERHRLRSHYWSGSFPCLYLDRLFTWFASLPPNSIIGWADLEKNFTNISLLELLR